MRASTLAKFKILQKFARFRFVSNKRQSKRLLICRDPLLQSSLTTHGSTITLQESGAKIKRKIRTAKRFEVFLFVFPFKQLQILWDNKSLIDNFG